MSLKKAISELPHPLVIGFGNPLLDVIIEGDENELLSKYDLKFDEQIELEEEAMEKLFADLPDE